MTHNLASARSCFAAVALCACFNGHMQCVLKLKRTSSGVVVHNFTLGLTKPIVNTHTHPLRLKPRFTPALMHLSDLSPCLLQVVMQHYWPVFASSLRNLDKLRKKRIWSPRYTQRSSELSGAPLALHRYRKCRCRKNIVAPPHTHTHT